MAERPTPRRRPPDPAETMGPVTMGRALRWSALRLAAVNTVVAVAMIALDWGTAASVVMLRVIAPLPLWGVAWATVAVLLVARRYPAAHLLAVTLWATWGVGAVLGLVTGATTSPAGSVALCGLVAYVAAQHLGSLALRRRGAEARNVA